MGESQKAAPTTTIKIQRSGTLNRPLATFEFKYRSKGRSARAFPRNRITSPSSDCDWKTHSRF